ncbi:and sulfurtransferase MOCS3 (Partial), partial [Seminavis robusta]
VLAGKPLISGSAIGTEGQLSVYNWKNGPCYRCLYPKPSITAGAKSCSDNGVLGPVPGLIGVLQSLEVLKVLTDTGNSMNERMLMYDSLQCSFMTLKKPKKQSTACPVCSGENATIKSMADSAQDLQAARGPASCDMYTPAPLEPEYQISCTDYHDLQQQRQQQQQHVLLDVRVKEQYDLCALNDRAINIPLASLEENLDRVAKLSEGWTKPVYCYCRRGVLSVEATKLLNDYVTKQNDPSNKPTIKNIKGGLEAWRKQVDKSFPNY